jgi:hypothetical protein
MKRLYIIVEGQTEEEFVKVVLRPYLSQSGIYDVRPIKITTSKGHKGGFVRYEHLKNDVVRLLKQEGNIVITTFVDFYKIPSSLPGYQQIATINLPTDKAAHLEVMIAAAINDHRFIPYIQLHEFEALLFSSVKGFQELYGENEQIMMAVSRIISQFPNPEDINDGEATAPSKRLKSIVTDYDKIVHGNLMAEAIGLPIILEKCPRFKNWLEKITETLVNQ